MESFPIKVENMEQTLNFIPLVVYTIIALICLRMLWDWYVFYKRSTHIKGFTDYLTVLEYHMSKAYDLIHKDRILVYSLEGLRVKDEDFNIISQDFLQLVLKFIGPSLQNDYISFYGNEDTFIFNMVEYFNTRYEEDSIRKQSMDEMSSDNKQSTPEVPQYETRTGN